MEKLLDWVEKNAQENLRFRLQNAESLAKDSAAALAIALAGMGGALAFGAKAMENGVITPFIAGSIGTSAWLALCAALIVLRCIQCRDLEAPANEPRNLFQPQYDLNVLREVELENIQARIEKTNIRNHSVAYWLDRCRLILAATPIIFLVGFLCKAAADHVAQVLAGG